MLFSKSLLESSRAGANIMADDGQSFKYPSYVQDIMGDIFSLGFGPFRCKYPHFLVSICVLLPNSAP